MANCYLGRIGLINSGGESKGAGDLAAAVKTAVINKRAGGQGLISGRKAFQRPMAEGAELLHAIQDVYLDDADHHRLSGATRDGPIDPGTGSETNGPTFDDRVGPLLYTFCGRTCGVPSHPDEQWSSR